MSTGTAFPPTPRITMSMLSEYPDVLFRMVGTLTDFGNDTATITDATNENTRIILPPYTEVEKIEGQTYEIIGRREDDGRIRCQAITLFKGANLDLFRHLAELSHEKKPEIFI